LNEEETMKRKILVGLAIVTLVLGASSPSFGVVIDFAGGVATLNDSSTVVTDNVAIYQDVVDYYVEGGIRVDFIGDDGTIGDYYSTGTEGTQYLNSVIHAHWAGAGGGSMTSIVFTKPDASGAPQPFDLNYVEITSNCVVGGGQEDGTELSYITSSGGVQVLLPSSDWGFTWDYYGNPGDGVQHVTFGPAFDGITSFTVTSQNAYCFGMDNFYIDEPGPVIPAPGAILLGGIGASLVGWLRRRRTL
jgi:hypothetical protein